MVTEMPHPAIDGAPARMIASPLRLSATPVTYRASPPLLGQHTDEILTELLGMDAAELAKLREIGVA
jgi:glutaryl-CoA transferase